MLEFFKFFEFCLENLVAFKIFSVFFKLNLFEFQTFVPLERKAKNWSFCGFPQFTIYLQKAKLVLEH